MYGISYIMCCKTMFMLFHLAFSLVQHLIRFATKSNASNSLFSNEFRYRTSYEEKCKKKKAQN